MRDLSSLRSWPGMTPLRLIRDSPVAGQLTMVMSLAVSALWLVPASTARPAVESQPPCGPVGCPPGPSYASLHVWLIVGIAGAVMVAASCALTLPAAESRTVLRAVFTGGAAVVAEVIVALAATRLAIVTAPIGLLSGEPAVAIAILGIAQVLLVAAFVLASEWLGRRKPAEPACRWPRNRAWVGWLGLIGMALGCVALAAWSLQDATTPVLVDAWLIAGLPRIVNVGAWWPGLFATQVALTFVLAAGRPGLAFKARNGLPRVPSASDRANVQASGS